MGRDSECRAIKHFSICTPKILFECRAKAKEYNGKGSDHLVGLWYLLKSAVKALLIGWYGDVLMRRMPRIFVKEENRCDSNCRPWTIVRIFRTPNLAIQCVTNVLATISAVIACAGIASGQREKRSMNVTK